MTLSALANGYILGWSVAWPPGPINAEMIRRGLLPKDRGGGFLFGLFVVLMSPWNLGFWLAVIGSQPTQTASVRQSLAIATAVVLGALTWGVVLCTALKFGAHIFSHPNWQVATEAVTAAVMLWFAIRLLLHFP
jgi:threonine/homoserine/homoserine lactone efflux protein